MKKLTILTVMYFLTGLMWSTVSAADLDQCVSVGDQLIKPQISEGNDLAISNFDYGKPCMNALCKRLSDIGSLEELSLIHIRRSRRAINCRSRWTTKH